MPEESQNVNGLHHGAQRGPSTWARLLTGAIVGAMAAVLLSAVVLPLSLVVFGGRAIRPALLLCAIMLAAGTLIGAWQRLRRA